MKIALSQHLWLIQALCLQYPLCMELLTTGQIDLKPMVSHRFGFTPEGISAGFQCVRNGKETKAIKVMFNLPP